MPKLAKIGELVKIVHCTMAYPHVQINSFGVVLASTADSYVEDPTTSIYTSQSYNYDDGTFFYAHEFEIISNSQE